MTLQYYARNVYGNILYYLANTRVEDQDSDLYSPSIAFLALIGKKTIDKDDMARAQWLGIDFELVDDPRLHE